MIRLCVFACCVLSSGIRTAGATAVAQTPAPATPKPAPEESGVAFDGGKARRPRWQPSLTLPKDLWHDVTSETIGDTAEWTNKVELADVDGDGRVDILLANGGNYDMRGVAVPTRVFRNVAGGRWPEITGQVFGNAVFFARAVKVRDIDGDGHVDVFVANTYQTQSRLYLGLGKGRFVDATKKLLPQALLSVGDAEFGDVDGDGDLDLVLADWGKGSPMKNAGARPRLWRNESGTFVDRTGEMIPDVAVRFCWELEFVDVDNDFDLDLLVSSKKSPGSFLFHNDGSGKFVDVSGDCLPQFTNNYEFEPMDLDGDGFLDLVTINDGVGKRRFSEHLLLADGRGGFVDATASRWPPADNPRYDDNMVAFLDYDSDGDADFLIASLNGPDRLLVNDGAARFGAAATVFDGESTRATLGLAIADLNGDGRMDCVHAEGEVKNAEADRVFFGKSIKVDSAAPFVGPLQLVSLPSAGGAEGEARLRVQVRVHDRKSPCMPHDWRSVALRIRSQGVKPQTLPMQWYGEYLWRADVRLAKFTNATLVVEAVDAAGNVTRSAPRAVRAH